MPCVCHCPTDLRSGFTRGDEEPALEILHLLWWAQLLDASDDLPEHLVEASCLDAAFGLRKRLGDDGEDETAGFGPGALHQRENLFLIFGLRKPLVAAAAAGKESAAQDERGQSEANRAPPSARGNPRGRA